MNLAEHGVPDAAGVVHRMHFPVDVEVHRLEAGRHWVLDCHRVMPPDLPPNLRSMPKGCLLTNLLRPGTPPVL